MTTLTWSSPYLATTATNYKATLTELVAKLAAAGLVQTGDSGQTDPSTIAAALATGTAQQGYMMFRMNDTLQSTQPIFIKMGIFNGSNVVSATCLLPVFTIGMATDGAGNLVGDTTTIQPWPPGNSSGPTASSVSSNLPSYLCVTEGFFGLAYKIGTVCATTLANPPQATISEPLNAGSPQSFTAFGGGHFTGVCRTVGDDGEPDGAGFHVIGHRNLGSSTYGASWACDYFSGGVNKVRSRNPVNLSGGAGGSSIAGAPQLSRFFGARPVTKCIPQALGYVDPAVAVNDVFQAAPVGTRLRTYIALGPKCCPFESTVYMASGAVAMLWE
jgi:hypothetical protein